MKKIKSAIWRSCLSIFIIMTTIVPFAFAQSNYRPLSILPGSNENIGGSGDSCIGLAVMIQKGNISLRQIPCFLKLFSQTLIGISGTLSVIFIMLGGYRYVLGGDEDKDSAKKTITYALIGLAVSMLAWVIVDVVLTLVTE